MDNIEIIIQDGSNIYYPAIEEGITWQTTRKGMPGILNFTVLRDETLKIEEGNPVRLKFNNQPVFYGFIFTKKQDKSNVIKVTAYDQLRYFKNKDSYVFNNKTASDIVKKIINDFKLNAGDIDDTGFVIKSRVENNKTLFDIAQNALDLTLQNTKKMFVLYDDFGKLALKNIKNMQLNLLIDDETGENYDYVSSIDTNTYNKIKLVYRNDDAKKNEIYVTQDSNNNNKWGLLQYFDNIEEDTNGKLKADALLSLYNKKTKNLKLTNVLGDVRVRGGSSVIVNLNLGDVNIQNYMIVDDVKHSFSNNQHLMDLTLIGGDFVA